MSLVGQALLMVAARALAGRTWAETRVWEQPVDPITTLLRLDEGQGRPAIAVYNELIEGEPRGLETQRGEQIATLKIIAYTPPTVKVTEGEDELRFEYGGSGFALNILGRQIEATLHYGNDEWVTLFRKFANRIDEKRTRYLLIELEDGVRIPSVELTYKLATIAEPEFGTPLFGYWGEMDTLLRGNAEGVAVADIIKRLIESPEGLPSFAQYQMANNLTDGMMAAIGLAPMATDEGGGEVPVTDVEFDSEIDMVGPDIV